MLEVVEQIDPERRRTIGGFRMAVAATVLLTVSLWLYGRQDRAVSKGVADMPSVARTELDAVEVRSVEIVVDSEFVEALSPGYLVHQPLVSLRLLSQGDWTIAMSSVALPFSSAVNAPRMETEWWNRVSDGISPVQESMVSTLDLIRRAFSAPVEKSSING